MNVIPSWMAILLSILGGRATPNEALDVVPTERYWQAQGVELTPAAMRGVLAPAEAAGVPDITELIKQLGAKAYRTRVEAQEKILSHGPAVLEQVRPLADSDDAEVATRAKEIVARLTRQGQGRRLRRLMALRALGELKDRGALGLLRKIAAGPAGFEAEYARRAIAQIEGKPFRRPALSAAQRRAELKYLPENMTFLAQVDLSGAPGAPVDYAKMKKLLVQANPGSDAAVQFDRMMDRITGAILPVLGATGNARLDLVTLGVSRDSGGPTGHAVFLFRGLYDPKRLAEGIKQVGGDDVEVHSHQGMPLLILDRDDGHLLLPSKERAILVIGANARHIERGRDAVLGLLKGKGASVLAAKALAPLLKQVGPDSRRWLAMRVSDALRPLMEDFGAFETFVAQVRPDPKDEDAVRLSVVAVPRAADDPQDRAQVAQNQAQVAAAVQAFERGLAEANKLAKRMAEQMPFLQSMVEAVNSVQVQRGEKQVTVTARIPAGTSDLMLAVPLWMLARQSDRY